MKKHSVLFIILLLAYLGYSSKTETYSNDCSLEILEQTSQNLKQNKVPNIPLFLSSFKKECLKNTEYTMRANDILRFIQVKYPISILYSLIENSDLDSDLIIGSIGNLKKNDEISETIKTIKKLRFETDSKAYSIQQKLIQALSN